jgi:hemerythrin
MAIRWRESMAVDEGIIDKDHQHLIDIINRFGAQVIREGADLGAAVDTLKALKFYTETHFDREESLQRLVSYPESQLQHDEHRRLLVTLEELTERTRTATGPDAADVVRDIGTMLIRWLLDHVIKLDLRMKPYAGLIRYHARDLPELRSVRIDSFVSSAAA